MRILSTTEFNVAKNISALALLSLMLVNTEAFASELDINISNKSANIQVNTQPPIAAGSNSQFDVGAGYIYREGGVKLINVDFHALGQTVIGNMPTTVNIGARVLYFDDDPADGGGLGLGGGAHVKIPQVPGLGVKASAHFAPQITTFGDSERLIRAEVRTTYRIIQNTDIYAGYRVIRAEDKDGDDYSIDENVHIGFTFIF